MFNIVNLFGIEANQWINVTCLILASLRVYLEIIGFEFQKLPITQSMMGDKEAQKFHRSGLYICVGYIILFGPSTLFSSL
jgi:hypothetical protein